MFKVQTFNNIAAAGLERLPADLYEVDADVDQPDAIILRAHNMHDMDVPESVAAIS